MILRLAELETKDGRIIDDCGDDIRAMSPGASEPPGYAALPRRATRGAVWPAGKGYASRQGVVHFRVKGKRDKIRFVPVHAMGLRLIEEYLALAGHGRDLDGPLFRPVKNNRTAEKLDRPLDPASVYRNIVRHYGLVTGINAEVIGLCVHSLRATPATTRFRTRRTSPRCKSGLATRTFPPRGCTTVARRDPRTAPLSGFSISAWTETRFVDSGDMPALCARRGHSWSSVR